MSQKPSFINALQSAIAAFFGVQDSSKHNKDFQSDTPFPFILAGVILAVGFVLILVAIVKLILSQ